MFGGMDSGIIDRPLSEEECKRLNEFLHISGIITMPTLIGLITMTTLMVGIPMGMLQARLESKLDNACAIIAEHHLEIPEDCIINIH